ncbi:MAG: hypothetical protein JNG86_04980 [Verrucomicrobiaceae bacterium]|nr:hypothetical protein [Verrucomicrobiaceae bacterium]
MNRHLTLLAITLCGLLCQCVNTRFHPNHALLMSERGSRSGATPLITAVDEREVTPEESRSGILLRPGPHTVAARVHKNVGRESAGRWLGRIGRKIGEKFDNLRAWNSEREIDFTAYAGRNYVLRASEGDSTRLWIEEQ